MADFNSSLPVRTESAGDIDVFISDASTPANKLTVEADGSINVNAAFAAGTKVRLTDGTNDSLLNASGELLVKDTDATALLTTIDADTSNLDVALSTRATEATLSALNTKFTDGTDIGDVTINNAAGASAVNIQDGGNSITIDDGGASITVDGAVTVSATDLDIRDLTSASDSVEVLQATHDNLNLNANVQVGDVDVSTSNPLPVIVSEDVPGTEIVDYNTSAAVASAASVNHDYTVSGGTTFTGEEIWVSGSGKIKAEVLINGAAAFTAFNSTAKPNIRIPLDRMAKAAAGQVIRITITNRDLAAQDVYSTLTGVEV